MLPCWIIGRSSLRPVERIASCAESAILPTFMVVTCVMGWGWDFPVIPLLLSHPFSCQNSQLVRPPIKYSLFQQIGLHCSCDFVLPWVPFLGVNRAACLVSPQDQLSHSTGTDSGELVIWYQGSWRGSINFVNYWNLYFFRTVPDMFMCFIDSATIFLFFSSFLLNKYPLEWCVQILRDTDNLELVP